jgi:hypothetical protein
MLMSIPTDVQTTYDGDANWWREVSAGKEDLSPSEVPNATPLYLCFSAERFYIWCLFSGDVPSEISSKISTRQNASHKKSLRGSENSWRFP